MPKWAWVSAVVIGSFFLIGSQFRCSSMGTNNSNGGVPPAEVLVSPGTPALSSGATELFTAQLLEPGYAVDWRATFTWSIKEGAAGGSITQQGVYTAPTQVGVYHVLANVLTDPDGFVGVGPGTQGVATVNVVAADSITVTVSPSSVNLFDQATQQFTATVTGTANTQVVWSIDESTANQGAITPQGLYTAPIATLSEYFLGVGQFYVRATPVADPNQPGGYAVVNVMHPDPIGLVAATPSPATVMIGGTQTFTATINGSPSSAVSWGVNEGEAGGTITPGGIYTPPATVGVYHVVATADADGTQSALVTVYVVPNVAAPTNLTYSTSPLVDLLDETITPDTPSSSGGAVSSYSVSPALPAGLNLDPGTGVISGAPTVVAAAATYTITASNAAGQTTCALSITVNNTPTIAPTNLTYSTNPATYTVGTAIPANTPANSGGLVQSYSVSPALPAGLKLDLITGQITGTPTAAATTAPYTVTATNLGGSTTASVSITVVASTPLTAELALPPFVHPGDSWMQASDLPAPGGQTYLWTLLAGTGDGAITSGQATNVIGFNAGSGDGAFQVQANVQNGAGGNATVQRTVTIQNGTWLVEDGAPATIRSGATATLLPSGRVLVAGGAGNFGIGPLASAEIYDPATGRWFTTGAMASARQYHTATLLADGTVLVAGGELADFTVTSSSEIYDPATGAWAPTAGAMVTGRDLHTATTLDDGTVLVAGGAGSSGYLTSSEIYTPATGTWAATTGLLGTARYSHTATLLADGKVLVAGGSGNTGPIASSEIYTPSSGTWTPTAGPMGTVRYSHTATLLLDGTVLAAGGFGNAGTLASSEIYSPTAGTWSPTAGPMATARASHTATLLQDGTVLAVGGNGSASQNIAITERYDPAAKTWSTTTGSLVTGRTLHTAALLGDGTVLVAGGQNSGQSLASSEIYHPATQTWTTYPGLGTPRQYHTATLLNDGTVLVAAGEGAASQPLATSLIYTPGSRTWAATAGSMVAARYSHTATLLPDGTVLVAGGRSLNTTLASAEIYNPATGAWTATAPMANPRYGHTATLLGNGKVLVAGGFGAYTTVAAAELFDPASGTWSAANSPLATSRYAHTATLLASGKVLVAGGLGSTNNVLASAELFDPATETWAATGSMGTGRNYHAAAALKDGTVLVAGGSNTGNGLASSEIYNPVAGTWSATAGSMAQARQYHTATLLPNGKVLVAGGWFYPGGSPLTLASSEIYDPAAGTWSGTGPLAAGRYWHTATLLGDGSVLAAFGEGADVVSEIYLP